MKDIKVEIMNVYEYLFIKKLDILLLVSWAMTLVKLQMYNSVVCENVLSRKFHVSHVELPYSKTRVDTRFSLKKQNE